MGEPLAFIKTQVEIWGLVTGGSGVGRDYTFITRPEKIAETIAHAREIAEVNEGGWSSEPPALPIRCSADK